MSPDFMLLIITSPLIKKIDYQNHFIYSKYYLKKESFMKNLIVKPNKLTSYFNPIDTNSSDCI